MRSMRTDIFPQWIHTNGPAIPLIATLILLLAWVVLPCATSAENGKDKPKLPQTGYGRLEGKWLRPDGGYVLELRDVQSDGTLKAAYFNPRPINVGTAEWRRTDDRIQVFVELQDVNYPGSTYMLVYDPEHDRLLGYYYQAVAKETFDVVFVRKEK